MKLSARNQLKGTVSQVNKGAVNSEVHVAFSGEKESIVAIITNESVTRLGLKNGARAIALIKASDVMIGKGLENARISARNLLAGKVSKVTQGAVNSEVLLTLGGGVELVAIITKASAEHLGLKTGDTVSAIVKASHVILGAE